MNTIYRLKDVLSKALSSPEIYNDEQEVFDELMVQKNRLLKLFEVGPRNSQEQREIESGKPILNNKATAVNADFARQVIFLSQQLDCSEKYVAETLQEIMFSNPNVGPVGCLEDTVTTYHQRRRDLVDCLRFLLDATEEAESSDSRPLYKKIGKFVKTELLPGTRTSAGDVSLGSKLFKELEQLDVVLGKADAARKNAGSNTVPPTGQSPPALGFDVLNGRYDSLKYERRYISIILSSVARLGYLGPNEVKNLVEWLSNNSNHPMTYIILNALLLSFDPIDPLDTLLSRRQVLFTDVALLSFMSKKFEPTTNWKDNALKAIVLLKWTMFLTEARHNDATLENRPGFRTEELETQVWNAVQGSAFTYLAQSVVHLRDGAEGGPAAVLLESYPIEQQDQRERPPFDFTLTLLLSFDTLVRSLITHASSELRKIKQRQEDLILATARTDRNRNASRFGSTMQVDPENSPTVPRHDIAMLYTFIGLLYDTLPAERALQFWGAGPSPSSYRLSYQETQEVTSGRLPAFLQWAIWSTSNQDLTILSSLYDMLTGIANGQQSSELAYNFMARGGGDVLSGSLLSSSSSSGPTVSWTVIFGILESWAINATTPQHPQKPAMPPSFSGSLQNLASPPIHQSQKFIIGARDVSLARSFLRLLAAVASNSVAVRTTIASHAHFRAIPTLLALVPLNMPLELKGAVFETLASFCEPGAGPSGVEICKAVWTLMERLEVINVRIVGSGGFNMSLAAGKGVEVELEQVESTNQVYPATIPFLKLLKTLIHTPKQISLQDRAMGNEPLNTIPDNLGQPYRLPGISPFTSFVVDNVFANIPNREYSQPSDRWKVNDFCLTFIERSLASFSLESLITGTDDSSLRSEAITSLLVHPGYDVMKRLLTTTPLQTSLLLYLVDGLAGFEKGFADDQPFFRDTITRVLRIVHRVLQIQDIFLDVFIPFLSTVNNISSLIGQVHSRSFFTKFDQILSFSPPYIPAIAAYMAFPAHAEVVLLSIKILARLSLSISSSSLVSLIQRSQDSDRILASFTRIVSSDSADDIVQAEDFADQSTGAGAPEIGISAESLSQATRLAALDLIIQDTEGHRPYPNIAHFLLFGGKGGEQTIQDPHALAAQKTSIHILLDLVNAGIPRLKGKRKERLNHIEPLCATLPGLAEKCYRAIYQLCMHPKTSDFTTRYLRTREDFFARQIAKIPSTAPKTLQEPTIQVVYNDGSRVTTTVPSLAAFLRLRSYMFDLVALELHILTNKNQVKALSELLDILFGTDIQYEQEHDFPTFHELGQSPMRIIDFLQSLMFDWADGLTVEPMQVEILQQLSFESCIRKDVSGCDVVDRTALLTFLTAAARTLHVRGQIATPTQHEQLTAETGYILESCAVENHRRKVAHARETSFQAWRRLLDLALTKCFDRLPHDKRENMLFDLLHVLPAAIRSSSVEESTCTLLSEAVLSSITKLREDRQHQMILQSMGADPDAGSLPAERLQNILRNILQAILDNNHVELVRGNLYAALINFIHLIRSAPDQHISPSADIETNPFALSLATSTLRDSASFALSTRRSPSVAPSLSSEKLGSSSGSALEHGCLTVVKPLIERLTSMIARDAIDGTEVWKSVAFMLLDAMTQLSSLEKQHVVLSALNRHGVLFNFVRSIKDSDALLQSVLKPEPEDLTTLYIYEAKLSLFIRMAQTRSGAEKLLDAQLLPILAGCDYLDSRPDIDQSFIDRDSFLPSAVQRYHQLFMPTLQVIDGILSTLGSRHTTATHQALEFLSAHASTVAILLKSEASHASLATLQEIHLLVVLCTTIFPSVPKTELLSPNSGFGGIHLAILGLSTRCLGQGKTFTHVAPLDEVEVRSSQQYAFGHGNQTKFDMQVDQKERLLRKALVLYIGVASDFTEPEITLVLSPITITARNEQRPSHFAGTIPSVGDALLALDDLLNDLTTTLRQISDIGTELSSKNRIGMDDMNEILRDIDPSLLRSLELEQKRSLLAQTLGSILATARSTAKVILETLEMLLLLLLRHIEYYSDPRRMGAPAKATVGNAMRLLATSEPAVFKRELGNKIGALLGKLSGVDLDQDAFGQNVQDNQGYIQIMCRRLQNTVGLLDNDMEND
ncbi:nucleoporin Nup186/Nup192/Nup205 [Crepidotus variabilis]|uniref:Nucleoporin Nup186/Nup192/Nup205 n=1 Tax=Crepidotus variabilis TaxID=179855 RepID=A0A9P6EGD8_9AGAR|nr:nucleoporin Nup186/Nup192/Nup205 [Crepidotus variabilis]